MGLVHTGETEADKELWRWDHTIAETHPEFPAIRGLRPVSHQPFPAMLYRAQLRNGKATCMAPPVSVYGWADQAQYGQACLEADSFTKSCQRIVRDEAEERRALSDGWRPTPALALAELEAQQQRIGNAAAEAAYAAQRMTATAKAELKAAEEATSDHVTDVVPVRRKRGRPPTRSVAV